MLKINLFDKEFKHYATADGNFSMTDGKSPSYFRYTIENYNWDGMTIFTNRMLYEAPKVKSKYKVAVLMETRGNSNAFKEYQKYKKYFDFVLTNDNILIDKYSPHVKFKPCGGSWIDRSNYKIYEKNKLVCMLISNKKQLEGHILRHNIFHHFHDSNLINFFGTGVNRPFDNKLLVTPNYYYQIVVENVRTKFLFSEKLLDALAVGSIPIYRGATTVGDFFDKRGIITFNTINELSSILKSISISDYGQRKEFIQSNMKKMLEYDIPEDWMYLNYFKNML